MSQPHQIRCIIQSDTSGNWHVVNNSTHQPVGVDPSATLTTTTVGSDTLLTIPVIEAFEIVESGYATPGWLLGKNGYTTTMSYGATSHSIIFYKVGTGIVTPSSITSTTYPNNSVIVEVNGTKADPFTAAAVNFNSTRLARGADLTGNANGKVGLINFWFKLSGGNGSRQDFYYNDQGFFTIQREANNKWLVYACEPSTPFGDVLSIESSATYTADGNWHNLIAAWDVGNNIAKMYIDDTDVTGTTIKNNTNAAYSRSNHHIGMRSDNANPYLGDVDHLYINLAQTLDITNSTNRLKFRTSSGHPEDLGSDGSTPTGTAPIGYWSGNATDFLTNKGSGGNFTVASGTLTNASSNP